MIDEEALSFFTHIRLRFAEEYCAGPRMVRGVVLHVQLVDILSVADMLQVAARILPTQLRLRVVRLQPRMGISPELRARRHTARARASHLSNPLQYCSLRRMILVGSN